MFGRVALGVELTSSNSTKLIYDPDSAINEHANFATFFQSFALLFRCSTGEGWQVVMDDLKLDPEKGECEENPADGHGSTCGSSFATFYMISFVLSGSFVILNLFVAVIVDNFEFLTQGEAELGAEGLDIFTEMWAKFDETNKGYITLNQLRAMLTEIEPPFGLKGCPDFIINSKLAHARCPARHKASSGAPTLVGGKTPHYGADSFVVAFRPLFMALVRLQKGGVNEEKGGGWKGMGDEKLGRTMTHVLLRAVLPSSVTAQVVQRLRWSLIRLEARQAPEKGVIDSARARAPQMKPCRSISREYCNHTRILFRLVTFGLIPFKPCKAR